MAYIGILKSMPADDNGMSSIKMLSAVLINIDEDNIDDFINDLILEGLLKQPNLLEINSCLRIVIDKHKTLFSSKDLNDIKNIIETVAAKYVSH